MSSRQLPVKATTQGGSSITIYGQPSVSTQFTLIDYFVLGVMVAFLVGVGIVIGRWL